MNFSSLNRRNTGHLIGLFLLIFTSSTGAQPAESTALTLPAIISEISARNPERLFYEEAIVGAKSGQRYSDSWADPELSFDLGRQRVKTTSGGIAGEGLAWSVSVTQTFEWPGRLALRKAIANRNLELAELGLERFNLALKTRASLLAYGLHASHTKAEAVREVATRFSALKETFLSRNPAGITPLLETRVIEGAELALQRRATEAELAVQAALIELNQLRGVAPDTPLRVEASELIFNALPDTATLIAAAQENNFEFRQRLVELEQQGFVVRLARNKRYPSISVSPFVSQTNAIEKDTTVGIGFSIPLPLTKRSRGTVNLATSRRRQAETAVLIARRELDSQVFTAAQAFATKRIEVQRWESGSVIKFREAADLADRHYRLGAVPIATYVELQNNYLDAVEAILDTQSEALAAGLKLQELTGMKFNPVEVQP